MVAKRFGSDHHALVTSAAEHTGLLDEAIWHLEGPIADVVPGLVLLSRRRASTSTVALLRPGYRRAARQHPQARVRLAAAMLQRAVPAPALTLAASAARPPVQPLDVRARVLALTTDDPVERCSP